MRILFTSDLHGHMKSIKSYSDILKSGPYDIGIISGDIIDDGVPDQEIEEHFKNGILDPDDFIEELLEADKTFEEQMDERILKLHDPEAPMMKALILKEENIKKILFNSNKDIFIIPGNHDLTEWKSENNIHNIHNKRIPIGKYNIIGYKWTLLHKDVDDQFKDLKELKKIVNKKSILVTHEPPYGILDNKYNLESKIIHLGSRAILELVKSKKPKIHLFGHVHSMAGKKGKYINGSFPSKLQFFDIQLGFRVKVKMIKLNQ